MCVCEKLCDYNHFKSSKTGVSFRISMSMPSSRFIKAPSVQDTAKEGLCFPAVFMYLFFNPRAVLVYDAPRANDLFNFTIASLSSEQSWLVSAHHTGWESVFCLQCDSLVRLQSGFFFPFYYYCG